MAAPPRAWAADLLHYWFHILRPRDWFATNAMVDGDLRTRFGGDWAALGRLPAASFLDDAPTALAAVLLFDQVPRNTRRKSPLAFASDPLARAIARGALTRGWDQSLALPQRQFLSMPLMHSEAIADQRLALRIYARWGRATGGRSPARITA